MADEIINRSLSNPLGSKLLLTSGEEIKVTCNARILFGNAFRMGYLILTNYRIVFYGEGLQRRLLEETLTALTEVSLDKNLLIGRELHNILKIADEDSKYLIDIYQTSPSEPTVEVLADVVLRLRAREMLRTNIRITDFSWLKSLLEKGGVALTAIKCPSCSGVLDIPNEGNFTKCRFCGQTVLVEELVDILRELKLKK